MSAKPFSPEWLFFSPEEERVVRLLLDLEARHGEDIARALEEDPEGSLRFVLANLAARNVLHVTAEGYRLNSAPEDVAEVRLQLDRAA